MPRYAAQLLQGTMATTFKSLGSLFVGGTLRRMSIYEIDIGQTGALNTSNDTQVQYDVTRFTSTSLIAGTVFTPSPLDGADPVTLGSFLNNLTAEATPLAAGGLGLSMLSPPINQRGTFRWRALDDGDNIIVPATLVQGVTVRALSAGFTGSTATAIGTIMYLE
jgi:hypothetical protein